MMLRRWSCCTGQACRIWLLEAVDVSHDELQLERSYPTLELCDLS